MISALDNPTRIPNLDYRQTDFIELVCMNSPDRMLTAYEIEDIYREDTDLNEQNIFQELIESQRLIDEPSEVADCFHAQLEDWFRYLRYRQDAFSGMYPFKISSEMHEIELQQNLNGHQKLYVFLLLASLLPYLGRTVRNLVTNSFECIGAEALRLYLGEKATVRVFGTGCNKFYEGNKFARLEQLARDIGDRLRVNEEEYSKYDSGDAGLDVVGWFPTHDESTGRLLVFGQCACGKDWEEKQHSSGYKKWNRLIDLSIEPVNTILVPHCFRDANGNWFKKGRQIHMSLMLDRQRIMKLFNLVRSPLNSLPTEAREVINKVLA